MMILSKERLLIAKNDLNYRQEILEKVIWLIEVLNAIAGNSYLSSRLVLKGGTALNLFYFNLPRLSVDVDLNYIGAAEREVMMEERPEIEGVIQALLERMGLRIERNPRRHAGGKMIWRYPSVFGNQGNLEIDLNFMYRVPLLPVEYRSSVVIAGKKVEALPVLDIHELAAGKLTALLERRTGRDFFDANELFQNTKLDKNKLRVMFVLYAAMCSKRNILNLTMDDVVVDALDLKHKLIPVIKSNYCDGYASQKLWSEVLVNNVRDGFAELLPFTAQEIAFIRSVQDGVSVDPDLFIKAESEFDFDKIRKHPALRWAEMKGTRLTPPLN